MRLRTNGGWLVGWGPLAGLVTHERIGAEINSTSVNIASLFSVAGAAAAVQKVQQHLLVLEEAVIQPASLLQQCAVVGSSSIRELALTTISTNQLNYPRRELAWGLFRGFGGTSVSER